VKGPLHADSGHYNMFRFLKTQKRLEEAEEKLAQLETVFKKLTLEWSDTYEKFRNLHFRVSKRVMALEAAEQSSADAEQQAGGEGSAAMSSREPGAPGLSPRQTQLQMKILQRRRG
jgi:hypothetical protein